MRKSYFFIGLPGSGKSTIVKELKKEFKDIIVISADELKEVHPEYNPKEAFKLHEWSVKEAEKKVYETLETNQNFIFDSGGINDSYSLRIMEKTKEFGYKIILTHLDTPVYECLRRISLRERKVPAEDVFNKAMKLKSCLVKQKLLADEIRIEKFYTNRNIVFDMDGTLVEYDAFPLKCDYAPKNMNMDYINNNVFEYGEPVLPILDKVKLYHDKGSKIFILSVSPNSETNKQKIKWLEKYLPFIEKENIYFVGDSSKKITTLKQIKEKHKIEDKDLTYVDDLHTMLWEAINTGYNAIHPSKFLTSHY